MEMNEISKCIKTTNQNKKITLKREHEKWTKVAKKVEIRLGERKSVIKGGKNFNRESGQTHYKL